ncbi:MAG TPA: hypothetical protein VE645_10810 [Pseudonocardiaceae bacterium]|jgi:hypothetical protein|nr:hypothetical protein [Pseudonocardiaceae bacterium]
MLLTDSIDRAVGVQHSVVANHVQRVRRRHPGAEPSEIIAALEKQYLATVTCAGAAVGASTATPRAGSAVAHTLIAAERAAFLEATALFTLAVAEVHGIAVHEVERRRMLLLAILLGSGRPGLARSGQRVGRWLLTRYRAQRWILTIGKVLPFGIGAALGAVSNRAYGRMVVIACRQVLGPTPVPERLVITEHRPGTPASVALTNGQAPAPAAVGVTAAASVAGKYRPLFDYLAARTSDRVEVDFFDIDQMVTGGLPKSASAQRGWWSNSPARVQAKAWLAAGFQVTDVDLAATTVRFTRRDSPS